MDTVEQKVKQEKFWNSKAKTFPRYDDSENCYEAGVLNIARSHGVDFKNANVLDIGCGSGMYTIRIAKEAKSVTATDISSEMLRILKEDSAVQGVSNIETFLCDWAEFESDKKFDVVFCSMTPAVQSEEGREKIMKYANGYVVYMGFAKRFHSNVMEGLFRHYGIEDKKIQGAEVMRTWLNDKGITYNVYPIQGEWAVPRTYEEMAEICRDFLSLHGIEADAALLDENIKKSEDGSGKYIERTQYHIEMIIWHA